MTTTVRLSAEYIMSGKKVVVTTRPRGNMQAGYEGVNGELTENGQTLPITLHDGNQIDLTEVDAVKKETT